jgi:hypothetical protein
LVNPLRLDLNRRIGLMDQTDVYGSGECQQRRNLGCFGL